MKYKSLFDLRQSIKTSKHDLLTAKDCGPLKTPSNGSLVGNLTTYPHKLQFMCDEGFNLRGSKIRQCLSTGNWSGNESFCEGTKKYVENVTDCTQQPLKIVSRKSEYLLDLFFWWSIFSHERFHIW